MPNNMLLYFDYFYGLILITKVIKQIELRIF